jgi:hypothetical protein
MQVPYDQGLANQIGPAVCADVREGMGEASQRGSVGWVLSRESALRCADPVGKWGRQHGAGRQGESYSRHRVVIDPMHAWTLFAGNWEISRSTVGRLGARLRQDAAGPCRGGC